MENKTYYLPTDEYFNSAFGNTSPVCVDQAEAIRLLEEWHGVQGDNNPDITFEDVWREAIPEEIAEYGVYDS